MVLWITSDIKGRIWRLISYYSRRKLKHLIKMMKEMTNWSLKFQTYFHKKNLFSEEKGPDNVETIGPTPQVEPVPIPEVPVTLEDNRRRTFWIAVVLVVVVAAFVQQLLRPESQLQKKDVHPIDIFRQEMEKVKIQFPSQREELWKRSRDPFAKTFPALNSSALHLEGASKSSQDSDMVKSDIDSQLQEAFEGGKPIAVIHRFGGTTSSFHFDILSLL
ncbi:hypothetical protein WMY93_024487 [Mugilogobius chulae]|uniref:Torsin-1A-interacting protein 1/2 AAA+ activator domain-containing protein n=1 Tax=Mugilogobius chulae TaxID=88201 RepID=A0AAW0NAR4_9GOBI